MKYKGNVFSVIFNHSSLLNYLCIRLVVQNLVGVEIRACARAGDYIVRFDTIDRRRWGTLRKRRFTRRSVDLSQWATQM